jgi:hypothetical protein
VVLYNVKAQETKNSTTPPHPITESTADAFVAKKKLRSRRFPVKVMFQGIITKPYPEHDFSGHIALKRISETYLTQKVTFNKQFDDSYHICGLLKRNEWRYTCSIDRSTTLQEAIDEVQHIYGLYDDIAERLCFSYYSFTNNNKKSIKRLYMGDSGENSHTTLLGNKKRVDENGKSTLLTLDDLELSVRTPRYTEAERDTTCDSEFMLGSVHEVGRSIRSSLHWVDRNETIHLFMDNAGGHGTIGTKEEYVSVLLEEYNIIVVWQVPNSPETNLLDLGFWATHQALVEWLHRLNRMEAGALSRTVRDAFLLVDKSKLKSIYDHWELVLELMIVGKGTNDLVESRRGLTKSLLEKVELDSYCRRL